MAKKFKKITRFFRRLPIESRLNWIFCLLLAVACVYGFVFNGPHAFKLFMFANLFVFLPRRLISKEYRQFLHAIKQREYTKHYLLFIGILHQYCFASVRNAEKGFFSTQHHSEKERLVYERFTPGEQQMDILKIARQMPHVDEARVLPVWDDEHPFDSLYYLIRLRAGLPSSYDEGDLGNSRASK